jgi:hypothetical protein
LNFANSKDIDMERIGTFTIADHEFACYLPSSNKEPQVWTIIVSKADRELLRDTVPLLHEPIFGPDVDDVSARDERVEEIIKELGLE